MPRSLGATLRVLAACAGLYGCPRRAAGPDAAPDAARGVGATAVPVQGEDPCASLTAAQRELLVARVGETRLTLCDFARRMNMQNQYLRARFQSPEQRRALLRGWVDGELLATEARARGLDRDPAVRRHLLSELARQLESQVRAAVPAPTVSDADVESYFHAHQGEYDTPEQVRASHLVVSTAAAAEALLTELRQHAQDDEAWRAAVHRASLDAATRETGGDLGFFDHRGGGVVQPEVADAAFLLHAPGEFAPAVVPSAHGGPGRTPGFHLVRFVARRDALHRTLEEVRRALYNRLLRERTDAAQSAALDALLARLRRETPVTIDDAALSDLRIDVPDGVPPAMPSLPALVPQVVSGAPAP